MAMAEEKRRDKEDGAHHGPPVVNTTARGGSVMHTCSPFLGCVAVDARVQS